MKIRSFKSASLPVAVALSTAVLTVAQPAQAGFIFGAGNGCDAGCTIADIQSSTGGFLEIGNVQYANWSALFTSIGAGAPPAYNVASQVFVNPVTGGPTGNGFELSYALNPPVGQAWDIKLRYSAETTDGSGIDSVTATLGSVSVNGTGTAGVVEDVWADGFGVTHLGQAAASAPPLGAGASVSASFAADNLVYVTKDISASSGATGNDVAFNSGIFNTHTTADVAVVPTPALLPGLLGFGASILRKRKKSSEVA